MSPSAAARLMSTEDSAKGFASSKAGARAGTQDNDETSERLGGASASGQSVEEHRVEGPETSANLTKRVEAIEAGQEELREGQKKIRLKIRKQGVKFMKAVYHLDKTISDKTNELKDAIFEIKDTILELKETVIGDRSASERRDNELGERFNKLEKTVNDHRNETGERFNKLEKTVNDHRNETGERFNSLEKTVNDHRNETGERFNSLDQTINGMNSRLEAMVNKLGNDLIKEVQKQHRTMMIAYAGMFLGVIGLIFYLVWTKT